MTIIEITAEQAEQFKAVGVRVRYAIHPSDLVVTMPPLVQPIIDVTPEVVVKRKRINPPPRFKQEFRKGTVVKLGDNYQSFLDKFHGEPPSMKHDVYQTVAMLLSDHGKPMLRHKLWHATNKFLGKKYTGTSTIFTKMLREGYLVTV